MTQLFPEGKTINLFPWEHNEVPVMLAAAFQTDAHIIALHLTRPPVQIPDRAALGMASHFAAARGAYILRPYRKDQKPMGTVFVNGTMSTANTVKILPELDKLGLNVKLVAAVSPELFKRQPKSYQDDCLPGRLGRLDGDHQRCPPPDARLAEQQGRRGVHPLDGLGQSLANWR